jgi:hypothetical protein
MIRELLAENAESKNDRDIWEKGFHEWANSSRAKTVEIEKLTHQLKHGNEVSTLHIARLQTENEAQKDLIHSLNIQITALQNDDEVRLQTARNIIEICEGYHRRDPVHNIARAISGAIQDVFGIE